MAKIESETATLNRVVLPAPVRVKPNEILRVTFRKICKDNRIDYDVTVEKRKKK